MSTIRGQPHQVTLLARIHASAENGLFVDVPHTNWLADIIETGVLTFPRDRGGISYKE